MRIIDNKNNNTDIKLQLTSLRKDIESVNLIQGKLDIAIDKLTDVSASIKSMLAVHEEKISQSEKVDEVIFSKIKEKQNEIDNIYRELKDDMHQIERRLLIEIKSLKLDFGNRVGVLEKYRWLILGGAIVIGWILSKHFLHIVSLMSSN